MEKDKEAIEHLTFYIKEYYAIKEITMHLFLLYRKSEAEIKRGKESIEFEIRGKISHLTHWMGDGTSKKADYATALIGHLTNLIKICRMEKPQALELLNDLYQAYKAMNRVGASPSYSTKVKEQTESMDTNDND
jgi:hypothetical protein